MAAECTSDIDHRAFSAGEAEVDAVDALLPQIQCGQCGYDACRPYAQALVRSDAKINRCPPGGTATIAALSRILRRPVETLDPACGVIAPRQAAHIDRLACIGCTLCIGKCPVDAIIGARKWMHAILESECTGCGLCVEPCPMDCITMVPMRVGPTTVERWLTERAAHARRRFNQRLRREFPLDQASHRRRRPTSPDAIESLRGRTLEQRRADIDAALARVRARKTRQARSEERDHWTR